MILSMIEELPTTRPDTPLLDTVSSAAFAVAGLSRSMASVARMKAAAVASARFWL